MLSLFLGLACAYLIAEGFTRVYFARDPHGFETMRARLAGEIPPNPQFQRCVGQPYLLYVPTPGYHDHNEQGYRGKPVPMERTAGVARVLCLGGSTTYGWRTPAAESTYPAQLEEILERDLPPDVNGIEVINAGIPWGTTAELLTHYHFKFHYFRPDLVIINVGGNDAEATYTRYYQPDYSHWRQPLQVPQPLSPFGRLLVKSRFASWLVILLLHGSEPGNAALQRGGNFPPLTAWHPASKKPRLASSIPDSELAFTHNLDSLIDEVTKDGAKILLVPFRLTPGWELIVGEAAEVSRNERILKEIAARRGLPLAPFPIDVISPENWTGDECHLKPAGCREKAEYLAPFARRLLWPSSTTQKEPGEGDRA